MLRDPGEPISPRVLTGCVGENLLPDVKRLRGPPVKLEQTKVLAMRSPARRSARPASAQSKEGKGGIQDRIQLAITDGIADVRLNRAHKMNARSGYVSGDRRV